MMKKIFIFSLFGILTLVSFGLSRAGLLEGELITNIERTFLALTIIYGVFKLLLEEIVSSRLPGKKTQYSFRKIGSYLYLLVFGVSALFIWVENPETLLVSFGVIAAGVAIALQDYFRNVAGGVTIFLGKLFKVGDRVEINGKVGDVVDIGVLYTTLMELREWVHGDQPTGRLVSVPNGVVLGNNVHNFTKDHSFMWDELTVRITSTSDWEAARSQLKTIIQRISRTYLDDAKRQIDNLGRKYYLEDRPTEPFVYTHIGETWVEFRIRYTVAVHERRTVQDKLSVAIRKAFDKERKIEIDSGSISVSKVPPLTVKVKRS